MTATIKRRKENKVNNHLRSTIKKRSPYKGGSVIAAGSFGCVFRPSLRCKNKKQKSKSSYHLVSKLGKKEVIESEYTMMTKLKNILDSIPNYDQFFALNVSKPCEPTTLNKEDLKQFDKKCKFHNIHASTVNDKKVLSSLSFVDLPYGGESLLKWIRDGNLKHNESYLNFLHESSRLIREGIVPMNNKGVLHNDIHARNILAKTSDENKKISHLLLIDWGLAVSNTRATLNKITVQRDYPITRIFFVEKIKKQFLSYVQSHLKRQNIHEYSFATSHPTINSNVYNILLTSSLDLIMLSQHNEKENIVHSCSHCDQIFKKVLMHNTVYKETFMPVLEKYISLNQHDTDHGARLYDIGTTFTTFINTMYLAGMMHKYMEMNKSVMSIKFHKYFTEIYRINADVYAMCNCILLGASKRFEYDNIVNEGKYESLAEVLLDEVFLQSTEIIDFEKVCDTLDAI